MRAHSGSASCDLSRRSFFCPPDKIDAASNDKKLAMDLSAYLPVILFILFELEIAFLFPWAVSLKEIGASGFWAMMVFLAILVVGFAYEWKKGALDWE